MNWLRIVFIAVGLVVAAGSAGYYVWAQQRGAAAREWRQAEGRIIESVVERDRVSRRSGADGNRRTKTEYSAAVTYAYEVNGRTYQNDRIWLAGDRNWGQQADAEAFLRAYPQDGAVPVFYDPATPNDSVLIIESAPWPMFLVFGMGLVFIIVGFALPRGRRPATQL